MAWLKAADELLLKWVALTTAGMSWWDDREVVAICYIRGGIEVHRHIACVLANKNSKPYTCNDVYVQGARSPDKLQQFEYDEGIPVRCRQDE